MDLNTEQLKRIHRIATENGFVDYKLTTIPVTVKGDNLLGLVYTVTIKSDEKKLELILKVAQKDEAFRRESGVTEIYEREIYVYESVFKEFRKFEEEHNITDPFRSVPKMYDFSIEDGNEYIILENLKAVGYQHWNKRIPMNADHIKAVLKEYAKFHAISFAMDNENPEFFKDVIEKTKKSIYRTSLLRAFPEQFDKLLDVSMSFPYKAFKDDSILTEYLQKLKIDIVDISLNILSKPDKQVVLIHSDCWSNNILFKYEDPKNPVTPSSLSIIDWQVAYLSSPAVDFCYFFLLHSTKEILEDYKTYLKVYYDKLASQLRDFNCDPEEVFPYSRFECHVKEFMKFGLFSTFGTLKLMLCDSEEVPNLSDASEGGELIDCMCFDIKDMKAYKERLEPLISFVKNNFS